MIRFYSDPPNYGTGTFNPYMYGKKLIFGTEHTSVACGSDGEFFHVADFYK